MTTVRVGILAGEESGDILGADLMAALQARFPEATFEGVGGKRMMSLGCKSLYPLERLSVMGFTEPLKRLPELIHMRRVLVAQFKKNPPDVFIGIDSPGFNTGLERQLKKAGIKTVHYVSPSVWAWRKKRIHKIKQADDLVLTLFPFETAIYEEHSIPVRFVGHPLADAIDRHTHKPTAKRALGFEESDKLVALMPGSRNAEISALGEVFLQAAKRCHEKFPALKFIVPLVRKSHRAKLQKMLNDLELRIPIQFVVSKSRDVLSAADAVLLASGTATLEAMLLKCPMVVAYRMSALTYAIAKCLVETKFIALPNILAGEALVPEFVQEKVTAETLSDALLVQLNDNAALLQRFDEIHGILAVGASKNAADAVVAVINS